MKVMRTHFELFSVIIKLAAAGFYQQFIGGWGWKIAVIMVMINNFPLSADATTKIFVVFLWT